MLIDFSNEEIGVSGKGTKIIQCGRSLKAVFFSQFQKHLESRLGMDQTSIFPKLPNFGSVLNGK